MARARNYLKANNPAAYYAKYVAPNLDRPGMAGAAANVERQQLIKQVTNQAVNPGLDIRPSPGAAVVAMAPGNVPIYGQVQAAPAPAPAPAPAAPSTPSVSQAAPPAEVTTQYTKQIEDLQAQLAAAEEARKAATLDWETRSKEMEESLAAQQAASQQAVEALKIQSQQELAKLTEASNLQISGLETALGGLSTELGTAGQTIQGLQGQMAAAAQEYEKGLATQQEQYQAGLAAQKQEYQTGLANLTANQRAFQINQARAGQGAELQIQPATPTMPQISGTSAFKRRPRVVPMQISGQANLNVPTANVLNI